MGFSRADWITIAITLLLFGLAYYASGAKAALICLSLGIVILGCIMLSRREKKSATAPAPAQSLQQTASPAITQSPTQNFNFNIGAHPNESHSLAATHAAPSPPTSVSKLEPNVRFVGAMVIDAFGEENTLYETQDKLGEFRLAVVCFRNDGIVGQRIHQPDVKAHIIYRNSDGREIADVPRGVWMQTPADYVEFTIAQKRCLVVLLLTTQGTLKRLWREAHFHEHSWMTGRPSYDLKDAVIKEYIASIEITLLSEGKGAAIMQSMLDVEYAEEGGLPKLKLRS